MSKTVHVVLVEDTEVGNWIWGVFKKKKRAKQERKFAAKCYGKALLGEFEVEK